MNNYLLIGDITSTISNNCQYLFISSTGEFFGMFIFIFFLISVILNFTLPNSKCYSKFPSGWIILGIALGLMCGLLSGYGIQYGLFHLINSNLNSQQIFQISSLSLNPAFVISNMIKGINYSNANSYTPLINGLVYILFELFGSILGAFCANLFFRLLINQVTDFSIIKNGFYTTPRFKKISNNFFSEFSGTFILSTSIIGLSLLLNSDQFVIQLIVISGIIAGIGYGFGGTTGYALNPIRDLGPRIVYSFLYYKRDLNFKKDWSYSIVPIIGPIMGVLISTLIMPGFIY